MKFVQFLIIILTIGLCLVIPESWSNFRDYFDPVVRDANSGHFGFTSASLIMDLVLFTLPVLLVLALFRMKWACLIAMISILYAPVYMTYGNYIVEPRGLHAPLLNLIAILIATLAVELLLGFYLKQLHKNPTRVPSRSS